MLALVAGCSVNPNGNSAKTPAIDPLTNWYRPLYELDSNNDTVMKWTYNEKGLLVKKTSYRDNKPQFTLEYTYEGNKCIYGKEFSDANFDNTDIHHCQWGDYPDGVVDEYEDETFSKLISVNDMPVEYDEQGRLSRVGDLTYKYESVDNGVTSMRIEYTFCDVVKLDEEGRVIYRDNSANYPSMQMDYYEYQGNVIIHTSSFDEAYRGDDGMIEGGEAGEEVVSKIYCDVR